MAVVRRCTKCREIKFIDEFTRDARVFDERAAQCKDCRNRAHAIAYCLRIKRGLCWCRKPIQEGCTLCSSCLDEQSERMKTRRSLHY